MDFFSIIMCRMLPLDFYLQTSGHEILAWSKYDRFWTKFSMSIAKIYKRIYELLWQEPSGLENDLFLGESTEFALFEQQQLWIENSPHSEKLKISLITKYPLTWGMQRRKVQLTLEEESFTGFSGLLHSQEGRTYHFFYFSSFKSKLRFRNTNDKTCILFSPAWLNKSLLVARFGWIGIGRFFN